MTSALIAPHLSYHNITALVEGQTTGVPGERRYVFTDDRPIRLFDRSDSVGMSDVASHRQDSVTF